MFMLIYENVLFLIVIYLYVFELFNINYNVKYISYLMKLIKKYFFNKYEFLDLFFVCFVMNFKVG